MILARYTEVLEEKPVLIILFQTQIPQAVARIEPGPPRRQDGNQPAKPCYVGYSESKYRLLISLAHPQDCHFAHVPWLPLSIEKPQTPFREIRLMFMFIPVR